MITDDPDIPSGATRFGAGPPELLHPLAEAEQELASGRPESAARLASEHALFGPPLERSDALLLYADAMAALGQVEHAADAYRSVLLQDPDSYAALYGVALLHRAKGENEDARAFGEQALRIAASQEFGVDYSARPIVQLLI